MLLHPAEFFHSGSNETILDKIAIDLLTYAPMGNSGVLGDVQLHYAYTQLRPETVSALEGFGYTVYTVPDQNPSDPPLTYIQTISGAI
jgi:hypothetical protein